jgi:RimJ/RimL family protein N-acetyltransferase
VILTPMPASLESPRLLLARQRLDDAPWLADLFTSRGGGEVSEAEARTRIEAMHELTAAHGIGVYVLRSRDDDAPHGYAGIVVGRGTVQEPELAYELLPSSHGQGYATEAARVVLEAAFSTGRRRIWATVRPWNVASLRVLEKLGGFALDRTTSDDRGDILWLAREAPL